MLPQRVARLCHSGSPMPQCFSGGVWHSVQPDLSALLRALGDLCVPAFERRAGKGIDGGRKGPLPDAPPHPPHPQSRGSCVPGGPARRVSPIFAGSSNLSPFPFPPPPLYRSPSQPPALATPLGHGRLIPCPTPPPPISPPPPQPNPLPPRLHLPHLPHLDRPIPRPSTTPTAAPPCL